MWTGLGAGLVSGGLNVLGGLASSAIQYKNNLRLMRNQDSLNVKNWNMQNDYNEWYYNAYQSPSAMVKQYKEAGLNPASLAGGSSPSVAQASIPGVGLPSSSAPDLNMNLLSGMAIAAGIKKTEAETANINANTDNLKQKTDHEAQMFPLIRSSEEARASLMRAQEEVQKSEKLSVDAKTAWQNLTNLILENTKDNQIALSKTQLETAQAELRVMLASAKEADKRGERLDEFIQAELDQMTAQIWMMSASAKYNEQLAATEAHRTETAKFEKFIMSRQNWRDMMRNLYEASNDESGQKRIITQIKAEYEATLAESEARSEVAEHEANDIAIWLRELSSLAGVIIGTGLSVFIGRGRNPKPA